LSTTPLSLSLHLLLEPLDLWLTQHRRNSREQLRAKRHHIFPNVLEITFTTSNTSQEVILLLVDRLQCIAQLDQLVIRNVRIFVKREHPEDLRSVDTTTTATASSSAATAALLGDCHIEHQQTGHQSHYAYSCQSSHLIPPLLILSYRCSTIKITPETRSSIRNLTVYHIQRLDRDTGENVPSI
jgi:hypothetical protein